MATTGSSFGGSNFGAQPSADPTATGGDPTAPADLMAAGVTYMPPQAPVAPASPSFIQPYPPTRKGAIPLPQIAVVEGLLLEVGIDALISRQVERIGKGRLAKMASIPREIETLSRKLVRGDLEPSVALSDFDWRRDVAELAAGWDAQQVIDMCKQFPPEYQAAASALIIKAQALIKELSTGLPLAKYQTFAGDKSLMPADSHIFKFASVLEVIRNPLIVFQLMAGGSLLKIQANAVRETYPTMSAAIDAGIVNATIAAKAEKKSFELNERAERGVKAWFGKGAIPTSALKQSQANVAASNEKKQPSAPPKSRSNGLATAAQQAEAKSRAPT